MSETGDPQYWFNTKTGAVEKDPEKSSWTRLMGPYDTREEAEKALETARQRTESWESEDEEWEED